MKDMKCNVCNKDLVFIDDGGTDKAYVALDLCFGINGEDERLFIERMVGPYEIDKHYRICPECWLRALGVKEK